MRYTLADENSVEAALEFKLDPELARGFGKEGIAAVEKAEGKLVDAQISGVDVGGQITASQRRSGEIRAELTRIEQRLAAGAGDSDERASLQAQAAQLRSQLSSESQTRTEGEEQLANTPMTFSYSGNENFTLGSHPFGDAASRAWESLVTMISVVLLALGVGLPWLLLAGLLLLVWRSVPGKWLRRKLKDTQLPRAPAPVMPDSSAPPPA